MDKDILRLVIVAVGGLVILVMILSSLFKNKRRRQEINFYDRGNPLDQVDESLVLHPENDDFDVVPLGSALDDFEEIEDPVAAATGVEQEVGLRESAWEEKTLPGLIQFSIVARADEGFNGSQLAAAFELVGLEYGSMQIYERVDSSRLVDFAVASMVEPGTFPDSDRESFHCPGIVFFMQPGEVDDPAAVFENFIQTIDILATELDGVKWDHQRQPLTDETVQSFRRRLS